MSAVMSTVTSTVTSTEVTTVPGGGGTPAADLTRAAALVDGARGYVREAYAAVDTAERYRLAHLAALRTAAAVLVLHAGPTRRRRPLRNAWDALGDAVPELGGWAARFAAGARRRAAIESGAVTSVSDALATEWLHAAVQFLAVAEDELAARYPHGATQLPLAG